MIEVRGEHNEALCYSKALDDKAEAQIKALCDQKEFAGCKIRIMPDVHAGMGCTIGTTMTIRDKIVPGMVGVDIGCGMETTRVAEREIDFKKLDSLIRREIPCGREVRRKEHPFNAEVRLAALRCAPRVNLERARLSIGTLGGGNHFIEAGYGRDGGLYIVVHSGSRHIGNEVAKYYQNEGYADLRKKAVFKGPRDLAYVEGRLFNDYIHDMKIIQKFATLNRRAMMGVILEGMNLRPEESFTTTHNYIDTDTMILRKGAVSAKKDEKFLVPINMRYGALICVGKGNPDWNKSAPHGAGRLMSRTSAFATLSMDEYRAAMDGVFSTCISRGTLDESPMAYKDADDIIAQISPTADIIDRIEPVYNFKAAE